MAVALVGLGVYKLIRSRHFRWGGMQVGFRDLTIWSFLMASAHGAGLMVLPVVLAGPHAHHHAASQGAASGVWATLIHTLGYFTVTAAVALLVYQKFGLAMLRRVVVQSGPDLGYRSDRERRWSVVGVGEKN